MDEKTLCNLSIRELAGLLRKRELSSAEVTRQILNRIRRLNPSRRAYITVLEDAALEAAAKADKEIVAGKLRGPLHGVPLAVKDLCFTKGVRTTCSSGGFAIGDRLHGYRGHAARERRRRHSRQAQSH